MEFPIVFVLDTKREIHCVIGNLSHNREYANLHPLLCDRVPISYSSEELPYRLSAVQYLSCDTSNDLIVN